MYLEVLYILPNEKKIKETFEVQHLTVFTLKRKLSNTSKSI